MTSEPSMAWTAAARIAAVAAVAAAIWHLGALAYVFASRFDYPMDLEWMEGLMLYQAHRFTQGEPVYASPGAGFLPTPYPPLFHVTIGLIGRLVGIDYATGRLVSIAFTALLLGVLGLEAWRHAASPPRAGTLVAAAAAMISVGAAAAAFPLTGGWFDLARSDTMMLALAVAGASLVNGRGVGAARSVAAAAALTASLYTKQNAALFVVWVVLWVVGRDGRRRGLLLGGAILYLCTLSLLALQKATGGWFWYWLTAMSGQPSYYHRAGEYFGTVLRFAPYLLLLPPIVLYLALRKKLSATTVLWTGMLAAGATAGLMAYVKAAGYLNNLMPMATLGGLATVLALIDLRRAWAARATLARGVELVLLMGGALYLLSTRYEVAPFVPTAELRSEAVALNAFVGGLSGGVVIPNHPFLAVRNGQPSKQFHSMTYNDANLARRTGLELVRYLEESGARWAILSGYEGFVAEEVRRVFPREQRLEHTVPTLVGFRTWPALLLERRHRRDRRLLFDFEGDGYGGWESTGDAFDSGPSLANQPGQSFIIGQEGLRLANSFHPKLFDGATGTLVSAPFTIDRSSLSLLVGGGGSAATRIELQVRGRAIRTASGVDNEILREVVWDLSDQQGQTARIAIIDEASGAWGHILVDQIELFRWADQ